MKIGEPMRSLKKT